MTNEQLVIRIKAGIDVADNTLQLYDQVKRFIHTVAWKYRAYECLEDLEQEGFLALYDAIDGYDPDTGYKFLTYAEYWIRQRIGRYIANQSVCVRISIHTQERIREYRRLCEAFRKEYHIEPSDRDICHYMNLSREQVRQLKKDAEMTSLASLDSPVTGQDADGLTVGDTIADPVDVESMVVEEIQAEQLKAEIWACVDSLEGRQSEVIRKRYQDNLTLREIGQVYGVSRDAIRQVESKALRQLRKPKYSNRLRPFMEEYIRSAAMVGVGARRFHETWESSTERVALRMVEHEKRYREILEQKKVATVATYRSGENCAGANRRTIRN